MDEYVGLDKDNIQSYSYFMKKHLFNHINIPEKKFFAICEKFRNKKRI